MSNGIHLNITEEEQPEFFGEIIDCIDDFLSEQKVRLPRSMKELEKDGEEPCGRARIYGTDYDDLDRRIWQTIRNWSKEPAKSHNVLVVKEHYDDEEVEVFDLSDDEKKAEEQARKMFFQDVQEEEAEGHVRIDENNTWWNQEESRGQIMWADNTRATYDVTYISTVKE